MGSAAAASPVLMRSRAQVEEIISDLRRLLGRRGDDNDNGDRVLGMWTEVESVLVAAELDELRPLVFARLFKQDEELPRSRDGRAQGGGR